MPRYSLDLDEETSQMIIEAYQKGFSAQEVIEKFNLDVTSGAFRLWLDKKGINRRRAGSGRLREVSCSGCSKVFETKSGNPDVALCKTCAPDSSWIARFSRYGITKPQFDKMLEDQNGLCDLCSNPLPTNIAQIYIDHCHLQGHVRALIHSKCNTGLHYLEDDKFVAQAFRYVERHKR